jgi:hypothetical protein
LLSIGSRLCFSSELALHSGFCRLCGATLFGFPLALGFCLTRALLLCFSLATSLLFALTLRLCLPSTLRFGFFTCALLFGFALTSSLLFASTLLFRLALTLSFFLALALFLGLTLTLSLRFRSCTLCFHLSLTLGFCFFASTLRFGFASLSFGCLLFGQPFSLFSTTLRLGFGLCLRLFEGAGLFSRFGLRLSLGFGGGLLLCRGLFAGRFWIGRFRLSGTVHSRLLLGDLLSLIGKRFRAHERRLYDRRGVRLGRHTG